MWVWIGFINSAEMTSSMVSFRFCLWSALIFQYEQFKNTVFTKEIFRIIQKRCLPFYVLTWFFKEACFRTRVEQWVFYVTQQERLQIKTFVFCLPNQFGAISKGISHKQCKRTWTCMYVCEDYNIWIRFERLFFPLIEKILVYKICNIHL